MPIVKFDTNIDKSHLTYNNKHNQNQIYYFDEELLLETCILSVNSVEKTPELYIKCYFKELSQNNKLFLNKLLILEEDLKKKTELGLKSCIYKIDNIYYINFFINKDTLIFNKHKKQVGLDSIFTNALVKCLIVIKDITTNEEGNATYKIQTKQILIINSF